MTLRPLILAAGLALTAGGAGAQTPAPPADPNAVPPPAATPDPALPTASPSAAPATVTPIPDNPLQGGAPAGVAGAPPAFDPAAVQSCLDASAVPAGRYACVGTAAQACMAAGNDNTIGMSECLGAERDWWKAALNETYDRLHAAHQKTDADIAGLPGAEAQAPLLEAAQKAWLAYREAECGYQAAFFAGGSASGPAEVGCEMDLTGRRAIDLMASLAAAETR